MKININEPIDHKWTPEDVVEDYRKYQDTHAICIAKDGYELKDHIDFHTGEYGWECEEYGDLDNKASYLITAILSMDKEYADEKLTRLKDILDEYEITYTIPELNVKSYEYGKEKHYQLFSD